MGLHPSGKGRAAYLFLAFEDELDVMMKEPRPHLVLKGLQVHEQLPFVVIGAAGIDGFLPRCRVGCDDGLEGVRTPLLQRLRRLHVIVPINEDGLWRADVLVAIDHGMAGRVVYGGLVHARFLEERHQALCAAAHIGPVLRLGADGRNPEERKQLLVKTFFVLLDVLLHTAIFTVVILSDKDSHYCLSSKMSKFFIPLPNKNRI